MIHRAPRLPQAPGSSLNKFSGRAFSGRSFSGRSIAVRTSAKLGLSLLGCLILGLSGCQTNPLGLAIKQPSLAPSPSESSVAPAADQYAKDINTTHRYAADLNNNGGTVGQPAARRPAIDQLTAAQPAAGQSLTLTSATADQPALGPSLITLPRGEDLQSYLTGDRRRVVLDFYADWCGPCRKQGKILHELEPLAAETGTLIIKVDVDQHKALAREYGVASLPTLIVVDNGEIATRQTGIANARTLKSWMR